MKQKTKLAYRLTQDQVDQLNLSGYLIVPENPTEGMVESAYYNAMAENAAMVWRDMVESWAEKDGVNG